MADKKEMTLMMKITANGKAAEAAFKSLKHRIEEFSKSVGRIGGGVKSFYGGLAGFAFAPLQLAGKAAGILAGGLVAAGSAAIYAAAEEEKLLARLTAVAGSAEQGKHALDEMNKIAQHSGMKTDDMAEAAIIMKQYGITSRTSLLAVGKAARVAGLDVQTLALQTMALQAHGLKRLGIEMEDGKDNPVLRFRDNAGKIVQIATKSAEEARRKLLQIYSFKFGTDVSPKTFGDFVQMLKINIQQVFERIGDKLLPAAKRFIDYISGGLATAIESGKVDEWGKKAGEWLTKAVNWVLALFDTLPGLFKSIGSMLEGNMKGFADVLSSTVMAAGTTLGVAFVEYLKASASIFLGIGKMIAGVFAEQIMQLPIPGMGDYKRNRAAENINRLPVRDLRLKALELGIFSEQEHAQLNDPNFLGALYKKMMSEDLTPKQEAGMAAMDMGGPNAVREGYQQFRDAIPKAMSNIAATAKEEFGKVNTKLFQNSGFDFAGTFKNNLATRTQEGQMWGKERVTAQFTEMRAPDPNKPYIRYPFSYERQVDAEAGRYKVGQTVGGGGVVINIQNLNTLSSDAGRMARDIMTHANGGAAVQAAY
jgi:hypothetical protein